MQQSNSLISKMKRRDRKFRSSVENMLVQAANTRNLLLLHQDIMIVSRQMDLCAAAAILPHHSPQANQAEDFLFLFLDLEEMDGLPTGFYLVRIERDEKGQVAPKARLLDIRGNFVRSCRFLATDPHQKLMGKRFQSPSKHVLLDSWIRRGEAYALEGVMGGGSPFLLTLEF